MANVDYDPSADDQAEDEFYRLVTWTGASGTMQVRPIRTTITKVVRTKIGTKEYMYWYERLEGYDMLGNKRSHTRVQGKYDKPEFRMEFDKEKGRSVGREVIGKKVVFDQPYNKEKLEELLLQSDAQFEAEIEEGVMTTQEKREFFYVEIPGGKRFEVYDRNEYLEGDYDELVASAKGGRSLYEFRREKINPTKSDNKPKTNTFNYEPEETNEPSPYTIKHYSQPKDEIITSSDANPTTIPDTKNFNRPKREEE